MAHLSSMLDFGVRTVGSRANEIFVPEYILREVAAMDRHSHPENKIEVDVQHPSGGFNTGFLGGFANTYTRVTNVVVRLSPQGVDADATPAMLVGAHFDSSIGTVGASDDLVNVAVLMEALRTLALVKTTRPIVFNLNGAEEMNWQAAHGFITQHPWAQNLRAVLNLEAAGAGGREMVIQNGPANAWIAREYAAHVPYPHVHGVAQLLFQSGKLPVGTDFQVYRDYSRHPKGKLPGMDWAVIQNGHVYHTPQDDLASVDPGHVQRLGENVVAFVTGVAASPHFENPGPLADAADSMYDILGLFIVSISHNAAVVVNFGCLVAAVLALRDAGLLELGARALLRVTLPAFGAAVAAPMLVGAFYTFTGQHILWYSHQWFAYLLFSAPAFLGIGAVYRAYLEGHPGRARAAVQDEVVAGATLFYSALLLPLALMGHTLTSFLVWVWFIPFLAKWAYERVLRLVVFDGMWVVPSMVYFVGAVPGLVVWWHFYMAIMDFFLPLTARIGNEVPPNVLVGVISGALLGLQMLIPMAAVLEAPQHLLRRVARGVLGGFAVCLFAAVALLHTPYTPARPKRVIIQHVARSWHTAGSEGATHSDAGLWIIPMDYEGFRNMQRSWPALANAADVACTAADGLYCDRPWYFPVMKMLGGSRWAEAPPPATPAVTLTVLNDTRSAVDGEDRRVVTVRVRGPSHMNAVVGQRGGDARLVRWSLTDTLPVVRDDCNCIWICHNQGAPDAWVGAASVLEAAGSSASAHVGHNKHKAAHRYNFAPLHTELLVWEFTMEFAGPGPASVAVYGQYLDAPMSEELRDAQDTLPAWASAITFSSSWASYQL
eukprot:TRINITY_DN5545_c0_g1_i2.p1 TRINITY_DN5545_c0_g1~~TRINITY_DN5545_c0_g1_i2.p1  ORF type:complete len:945 (+),score=311.32 TRINITY_DN5545_c0_g1_i2:346-2835(+)